MQIRACAYCFLALLACTASTSIAYADDDDDDEDAKQEEGDTSAPAAPAAAAAGSEPASLARPLSLGLLLGYGFDLKNPYNMWGLGLGLRGGYNFGPIYFGGRFVYQFGDDRQDSARGMVIRDFGWHHWDFGVEGGYDVTLVPLLTLRPELGLGMVGFTNSLDDKANARTSSDTTVYAYFALGATVVYDVAPNIFLGGDIRLQIVVGGGATEALTFLLHGGMRF